MRHLEELKEKYKDGWWEGHDGYSGDDMLSDIQYLIFVVGEYKEAFEKGYVRNRQGNVRIGELLNKVKQYEDVIGAIANIDGAFITPEGDCDYTDKQALEKITEWVDPIWSDIAKRERRLRNNGIEG